MKNVMDFDYGPLAALIGTWTGDKGMDVAPAPPPDSEERNPFYETIVFEPIGDVTNADEQVVVALFYRQIVRRTSNDEVFHDQTGYWMWDAASGTVMQSLTIPRGVCLLAGGTAEAGDTSWEVKAELGHADWPVSQSPFMRDKASTRAFSHHIAVGGDRLSYKETTLVDIFGSVFEHTDENELRRQ